MAETAEELLKSMAAKKAGATKKPPEFYYSKILVNKNKRTSLMVGVVFFLAIFLSILFAHISIGKSWTLIIGPILLCGAGIVLIPISENWVYQPWQVNVQKYERHFTDRLER